MKRPKSSSVFRRYLTSYIIILIIPLLTGIISYSVSIQTAEKYSIINSTQVLNQSKAILEQRLTEIERFVRQLAANQDLITLLNKNVKDKSKIVSSVKQLATDLSPYALTNEFLEDFYIYLESTDLIVIPGSVYFRPHHFYRQNHYLDLTFSEWKSEILRNDHPFVLLPNKPYVKNETETNVITYIQSLPLDHSYDYMGSIVVPIEEHKLNDLLEGISDELDGWSFITDENFNIMAANGIEEEKIENIAPLITGGSEQQYLEDGTLLIFSHSSKNGWVYVAGIPNETLVKEALPIKYITWSVTGSTLIIGLIISLFFAYRNSRPINKLMRILKDYTELDTKNDYDFLHGNISKLINSNTDLQAQLAEQKPLLKDAFLKQLLSGELTVRNGNLQEFAKQVDVHLNGDNGYVCVLKIEGYENISSSEIYEELHAIRLVIQQESMRICRRFYLTNMHSDKLVYIFIDDQEQGGQFAEKVEKMFKSLQKYFQKEYRITLKAGLGNSFHSLSDISRSYNEAKQAVEFAVISDQGLGLFWYDELMKESTVFYYPLEYEFRLLKNLKEGDVTESKKIIHELFEENLSKRCLPTDMIDQFVYEVKGTFFKLFEQYTIRKENAIEYIWRKLLDIQRVEDMNKIKDLFFKVIDEYCEMVKRYHQETNHSVVNAIKAYLKENYPCTELNLYMIAEYFGRPEKYISQIFKEESGEYIYEYLERIRINESMDLLTTTNKTIVDISETVGYNSAHSFRRAFKRINNVTPNQYRNTMRGQCR
ncbi:helix-turn-helix domain-containing protein [Gracilibacillus suaedae]|uniref:helix-turn-helix domain-containing protein n=1 Tax=Gracilibacillus suaedae TaxID=2820273 RepID=UPI001ABECE6D|nr:helix-turn-helix domain-containing protein [Gracilibacillus suaedae]